jgi:hypothetical protein
MTAEEPATGNRNLLRKLLIPVVIVVAVFAVGVIVAVVVVAYRKRWRRSSTSAHHDANGDDDRIQELGLIRHHSLRNRHYNLSATLDTSHDTFTNELPSIAEKTKVPAALPQYKFTGFPRVGEAGRGRLQQCVQGGTADALVEGGS